MKSSNKGLYLSIPTPCQENWDNMNSIGDSKFCSRCKKNLIDFSTMSDIELLAVIKNGGGELCGRFEETQLNRLLKEPAKRNSRLLPVALASAIMAITFTESNAQTRPREQVAMGQYPEKDSSLVKCQLPEVVVTAYELKRTRSLVTGVVMIVPATTITKVNYDPTYYSGKSIKIRKKKP